MWEIQEDSDDSGDSDRRSSGAYWIQGDSSDSNDSGDLSPADSLDSRTCKEFKPGGISGRRWLGGFRFGGFKGFKRVRLWIQGIQEIQTRRTHGIQGRQWFLNSADAVDSGCLEF